MTIKFKQPIDLGGQKIGTVGTPTTSGDATTKAYVDSAATSAATSAVATANAYTDSVVVASTAGVTSVNGRDGVVVLDKTDVGLVAVDDTADVDKPISTAQQAALDLLAPLDSPTFTGTVAGITKTMVGLSNVDNTSDANKPVSTAQATVNALKANLASPTFTGTPAGPTAAPGTSTTQLATTAFVLDATSSGSGSFQPLDSDLTTIAALSPADTTIMQRKAGAWVGSTPATVKIDLALTKTDVGLGTVDNTSDVGKPVSTAQAAADAAILAAAEAYTDDVAALALMGAF